MEQLFIHNNGNMKTITVNIFHIMKAQELVDERFVRQAIESTQSQQLFGLPADYRRTETIVA